MALVISSRVLGKRKPLLDDFSVPPPDDLGDGDPRRLRDIIEHVVRHEVNQFERRQAQRRFDRVLSAGQIATDAARGKIDPAAREATPPVDAAAAVANAWQAFDDGMYLVLIDGIERKSLDDIVHLTRDSQLVFVRLTFLAGA